MLQVINKYLFYLFAFVLFVSYTPAKKGIVAEPLDQSVLYISTYAVANGTDQATQIQQAIDAAGTLKKKIIEIDGFFSTSKVLKFNLSNITIRGQGRGTGFRAIPYIDSTNPYYKAQQCLMQINLPADANQLLKVSGRLKNIILKDFELDMSAVPAYWKDNIWGYPVGRGALSVFSCDNVLIDNIYMNDVLHSGLTITACYNVKASRFVVNGLRSTSPQMNNPAYTSVLNTPSHPGWNLINDGNCVNLTSWNTDPNRGNILTYNGPLGEYDISNFSIIGTTKTFPSRIVNNVVLTGNLGIQIDNGGDKNGFGSLKNIHIHDGFISKCFWAIAGEGMTAGGSGRFIASNNTIDSSVYGIWLAGDDSYQSDNTYDCLITNNRLHHIFGTAIAAYGNRVIISNNIIYGWGIGRKDSYLVAQAPADPTSDAIRLRPYGMNVQNTNLPLGMHYLINNNIAYQDRVIDNNYILPITGLHVWCPNGQKIGNITVSDCTFDLGKATKPAPYFSEQVSGIVLEGEVFDFDLHSSYITGAASCGFAAFPNGLDYDRAPRDLKIYNNRFVDNGYTNLFPGSVINIKSDTAGYTIYNNDFIERSGKRMAQAVLFGITKSSGFNSANRIFIYNNHNISGLTSLTLNTLFITNTSANASIR